MHYEFSLNKWKLILIITGVFLLALLFFLAGVVTDLIVRPKVVPNPTISKKIPTQVKILKEIVVAKPLVDTIETEIARNSEKGKQAYSFRILVDGFRAREDAERAAGRLKEKGYSSYVFQVQDRKGNGWYAVMIGDYENPDKATQAFSLFQKKERLPAFITYVDSRFQTMGTSRTPRPYCLRVACYKSEKRAGDGRALLWRKGISTYMNIATRTGKKQKWWVLYTGHYKTEKEAKQARSRLKLNQSLVRKFPYTLFFGIFQTQQDMAEIVTKLDNSGFHPFIRKIDDSYELLAGLFEKEEDARDSMLALNKLDIPVRLIEK